MFTATEKLRLLGTAATKYEWQTAYCAALLTANTSMRPIEVRRRLWRDLDPINRVVPLRVSKTEAGTRPRGRGGWRTAWRSRREAAAKKDTDKGRKETPRLANLRYYDLRRQFITELHEAGQPEAVIRALAGHVEPAVMRIYSHPQLAAKRLAVRALTTVRSGQSEGDYLTNPFTKSLPETTLEAAVLERNGRGARI
jgi:integrase